MTERSATEVPVRARIVLIKDEEVALIERQRDGRTYHAFPGGGVVPGETPEEAAVREAWEELGLAVKVKRLLATMHFEETVRPSGPTIQHYFEVAVEGGSWGTGTGEEYGPDVPPQAGTYRPCWIPLHERPVLI
jgi:ADP-ribose pyrophosphatase YjhB (NUDIX family)